MRTIAELRRLLRRKGFRGAEVSGALAKLEDLGYVDDSRYASTFIAFVAVSRAWGPARVRRELASRGVPRDVIEAALKGAAVDGILSSANLDRAIAKHLRAHGVPVDRRGRDRLRAALRRQGFALQDINRAVAALSAGGGPEEGAGEEA